MAKHYKMINNLNLLKMRRKAKRLEALIPMKQHKEITKRMKSKKIIV